MTDGAVLHCATATLLCCASAAGGEPRQGGDSYHVIAATKINSKEKEKMPENSALGAHMTATQLEGDQCAVDGGFAKNMRGKHQQTEIKKKIREYVQRTDTTDDEYEKYPKGDHRKNKQQEDVIENTCGNEKRKYKAKTATRCESKLNQVQNKESGRKSTRINTKKCEKHGRREKRNPFLAIQNSEY